MRLPDYITTAQTNLLRTKLRTFLTVFAFVIGTFTLAMTTAFGQGLQTYLVTQLNAYGQANIIDVGVSSDQAKTSSSGVPYYDPNREASSGGGDHVDYTLNQHDLDVIGATPSVKAVYPSYSNLSISYIQSGPSPRLVLSAQSAVPGENTALAAGKFPDASQATGVVLPYPYVEALGAASPGDLIGKTVTMQLVAANNSRQTKNFTATVTGVLPDTAHTPGAYLSYQMVGDMVKFQTGSTGKFTDITVVTTASATKADRDAIKKTLQGKGYRVQTYDDILASFSRPLHIIQYGLDGFAAIALLAATIGIVNTLLMAVLERTQEIGLFKALGMRRRGITVIYLVEAASIGFWGGVIGVAGASLLGLALNPILSHTLFKGLGKANILTYPLPYMLGIMGGAMVIGLLAGTLPAIRASRLNPITALRQD